MWKFITPMLSSFILLLTIPFAYGQSGNTETVDTVSSQNTTTFIPEETVGKSENLTVNDIRYRGETNQITGTIINNSTAEQSSISIYVVLFDVDDTFLGIAQGRPLVESLPPGDNSPFSVDLMSGLDYFATPEELDDVHHYTIYVKGHEPLFGFE